MLGEALRSKHCAPRFFITSSTLARRSRYGSLLITFSIYSCSILVGSEKSSPLLSLAARAVAFSLSKRARLRSRPQR